MRHAIFMPRPPPPNAALMMMGRPCCSAKASTSLASFTGSGVPTTSGAPTLQRDLARLHLVAQRAMVAGRGPIQARPASITAWAKAAFSDRKP
jgi:hypothetical protein